jgi:hypothetical protein
MKQLLFLACVVLIANACEFVEPDGKQGDTIKFSRTKLFFTAQGGADSVTSQGTDWEIVGMGFDKKGYFFEDFEDAERDKETYVAERLPNLSYPDEKWGREVVKVKAPWFTFSKQGKQKLIFTIAPNGTSAGRDFWVQIVDRNYQMFFTVTQSAE